MSPSRIVAGNSARVTLTGDHLCDLELSTSYPGVTISDVAFDGPVGAGTSASATIAVAATAAAGTATVEVRAGEGTATFELTIGSEQPDFTITAAPESGAIGPGGSAAYTVSVTPLSGFNQAVTLSASGLAANVTAAFDPVSLSSPYGDSTLTLTGAGATAGTTVVTVTGTAGALSRTVSVSLTVSTAPPLQREYIYLGGRLIAVKSP